MKYKLGSRLLIHQEGEVFEWNFCLMGEGGRSIESIWLGDREGRDPIIRKARELVEMLNEEKV